MRASQLVGLLLWRGGLLLIAATVVVEVGRWVLRFWDLPRQVELGLALVLAGCVLVLASLVVERIQDARDEGGLRE